MDISPNERYAKLKHVCWKKCFVKTYKESRSWFHLLVDFNRIWVIHLTMFWFYTASNAPSLLVGSTYEQQVHQQPPASAQRSVVGLGGGIAALVQILATVAEWSFVPRRWAGTRQLSMHLLLLVLIFALSVEPSFYVFGFPNQQESKTSLVLGVVQFCIALSTFIYFSVIPLGSLFGPQYSKKSRPRYLANRAFTAN